VLGQRRGGPQTDKTPATNSLYMSIFFFITIFGIAVNLSNLARVFVPCKLLKAGIVIHLTSSEDRKL
jgi:hypothetical protein